MSEIPTARLRGLNVSLAAATQWLFNLVIARAVPNMLATMGEGGYGAFIAFSCFCFSMFVFVWFLVPETKVSSSSSSPLCRIIANLRANREWHSRRWMSSSVLRRGPASQWTTRRVALSERLPRRTVPTPSRSKSARLSRGRGCRQIVVASMTMYADSGPSYEPLILIVNQVEIVILIAFRF